MADFPVHYLQVTNNKIKVCVRRSHYDHQLANFIGFVALIQKPRLLSGAVVY